MEAVSKRITTTLGVIAGASLALSISAPVNAQPKPYLGVGAGFFEYEEDGVSDDATLAGAYGRAGVEFIDNISGELRLGTGIGDDDVSVGGTNVTVELDYFVGAYLRGSLPVHETVKPYAIIGATEGELTASAGGFSVSASESDLSYGFGLDFLIDERSTVSVEYMSYLDKDEASVTALTASVSARF